MASKIHEQAQLVTHEAYVTCPIRSDDVGLWNFFKAWCLFPLHLACCSCFVFILFVFVDGQYFWTASPPDNILTRKYGLLLHQTEVSGLVSAALVLIRLVGGCGSGLVVWRLIFLLLEIKGLSIAELSLMVDLKIPIQPRFASLSQTIWSFFAIVVTLLLWPNTIAAPLANSAIGWQPSIQLVGNPAVNHTVRVLANDSDFEDLQYAERVSGIIFNATQMASRDISYAFNTSDTPPPPKRYVHLPPLPAGRGTGNVMLPYFKIAKLEWRNPPETYSLWLLDSASISENIPTPQNLPMLGTVSFFKEEKDKWVYENATKLYKPEVFTGKREISVLLSHMGYDTRLENGSVPNGDTPCQIDTKVFGKVPQVKQQAVHVEVADVWVATQCWMLAEITIQAGVLPDQPSDVVSLGLSNSLHSVSASLPRNTIDPSVAPDLAVRPTLDIMTDVMRQIAALGLTEEWQRDNLDRYVKGMLTTAYYATWSALPARIKKNSNETLAITPMERVIQASVNRQRVYIWLAMNVSLSIAAALIGIAHHFTTTNTKTIRHPTLAALTMDLSEVAHQSGSGLCNAVTLNKEDHRLGRLKWKDSSDHESYYTNGKSFQEGCYRRLKLAKSDE
jgi:hypothetical protein